MKRQPPIGCGSVHSRKPLRPYRLGGFVVFGNRGHIDHVSKYHQTMTDVNRNQLGKRLKALRGEKTLYQAAKEAGIDRGQLRRYEEGRIPEDRVIDQLARFYRVPYNEMKALCFEDLYPEGSKERVALVEWLQNKK